MMIHDSGLLFGATLYIDHGVWCTVGTV